ncbi:cysteine ABC transporter ATP-binding protein [Lysinibacillus sphaericus]|uniref:SCO family protein n=1 Tax=Lysinibacillus sphaericus TaxID=1421 RepID=UPI0018CD54A0|nr:SCO family protein [Lysinibacillus sphaericus]MBG9453831.1 cysteine ABC transporter ATP-binding protein [Lysinibacillus sphaericus]MBG9476301.1 cysteine ABC transporter ATP-binding protein [Lysinibacillus sphaericus]MBG9591716.1 cysteine ABC transporter ATP-binding protein [Lysinibacillus sphaericus]
MKKKSVMLVLILTLSSILAACGSYKFEPEMNIEVQDFSVTNQNNEKISLNDLKGKPWLAMFIFTNCNSICPPMTYNMTEVQKALQDKGVEDYQIVAFSVDPEVDKPEVLTNYLKTYSVPDASKWQLLTGYEQKYIEQFARKSFNSLVKNDPNSDQVVHMSSYYLVDADGMVVKDYDGTTDVPVETIVADMKALTK